MGSRVSSLTSLSTAPISWPRASARLQAVRLSATGLMYSMRPSASVLITASPIDCRVTCARSFSANMACSARLRSVMLAIVPS